MPRLQRRSTLFDTVPNALLFIAMPKSYVHIFTMPNLCHHSTKTEEACALTAIASVLDKILRDNVFSAVEIECVTTRVRHMIPSNYAPDTPAESDRTVALHAVGVLALGRWALQTKHSGSSDGWIH